MTASYIAYHPEQQQLLPCALQEWLPEGHLAYFINDTVDSLSLSAFHARYAKDGPRNQPFHLAVRVKVMVYAYATGTFSSRKIASKLHEDVAFGVLAASNFPAHRTIREFRALHLSEFSELFVQVVRLARELGQPKLAHHRGGRNKDHSQAVVTVLERKSGYAKLKKVANKTAELVSQAIEDALKPVSARVKSLTVDNGKEFAYHQRVDQALGIQTYFADPY